MATKGGKGKKKSDKKVTNEVSVGTDDPEPRNVRDNKPVNLSTLAKDSLASQDKRTNENKSTDNTEKETNKNSPFTIISLSHKKGTLKEERKKKCPTPVPPSQLPPQILRTLVAKGTTITMHGI